MGGKKKSKNPAKVNLKNIGNFLQGYARMFSDTFLMLDEHKKEQVIWREARAHECTVNKSCTYCGCDTPAKYYCDDACVDPEKQCYPAMMDKKEWEEYKANNNITVVINQ